MTLLSSDFTSMNVVPSKPSVSVSIGENTEVFWTSALSVDSCQHQTQPLAHHPPCGRGFFLWCILTCPSRFKQVQLGNISPSHLRAVLGSPHPEYSSFSVHPSSSWCTEILVPSSNPWILILLFLAFPIHHPSKTEVSHIICSTLTLSSSLLNLGHKAKKWWMLVAVNINVSVYLGQRRMGMDAPHSCFWTL